MAPLIKFSGIATKPNDANFVPTTRHHAKGLTTHNSHPQLRTHRHYRSLPGQGVAVHCSALPTASWRGTMRSKAQGGRGEPAQSLEAVGHSPFFQGKTSQAAKAASTSRKKQARHERRDVRVQRKGNAKTSRVAPQSPPEESIKDDEPGTPTNAVESVERESGEGENDGEKTPPASAIKRSETPTPLKATMKAARSETTEEIEACVTPELTPPSEAKGQGEGIKSFNTNAAHAWESPTPKAKVPHNLPSSPESTAKTPQLSPLSVVNPNVLLDKVRNIHPFLSGFLCEQPLKAHSRLPGNG